MRKDIELYCKDATEIFLDQSSVNLFFMNPSYVGSALEEYGGSLDSHINNVQSIDDYLSLLIRVAKHVEHSLAPDGSAFIMLQNQHNIVPRFCSLIETHTGLTVGQLFVWDFSDTENLKHLKYEKMGLIVHLYKGSFYVDPTKREYVLRIPFDPQKIKKYNDIGFIGSSIPEELYENFILAFSKEGDTFADIFGGTGTGIVSSVKLNRKAIYNDIAESQYKIATSRISDLNADEQ